MIWSYFFYTTRSYPFKIKTINFCLDSLWRRANSKSLLQLFSNFLQLFDFSCQHKFHKSINSICPFICGLNWRSMRRARRSVSSTATSSHLNSDEKIAEEDEEANTTHVKPSDDGNECGQSVDAQRSSSDSKGSDPFPRYVKAQVYYINLLSKMKVIKELMSKNGLTFRSVYRMPPTQQEELFWSLGHRLWRADWIGNGGWFFS